MGCRSICATEELEAVCIPFIAGAHTLNECVALFILHVNRKYLSA
jgi:hypothetical protein